MAAKAKPVKSLEVTLWEAADKLRGNLEASEYKHVVLGLVFLKYVSDSFTARRLELEATFSDPDSDNYIKNESRREKQLELRDEYTSENVFWVPEGARWPKLLANTKSAGIGQLLDAAMDLIEADNPSLKGVLPKNYGRPDLDKRLLGELVDLIGNIPFTNVDHGSDDVLGKVYEYFLGKFAGQEGRGAGEFYTPRSVVRLLVEMLEPYKGRVYDPCCGSGGMFVQSEEFVKAHGGKRDDLAIYGQEFVGTTWRLAKMNIALRGIDADLGDRSDDAFHHDLHPDLRADFILANPPFNLDDWYSESLSDDPRWKYGLPPAGNGNFAWVQHFLYHLAPNGVAGFVLANGSLSANSSGEGDIRRKLIEADVVDCIVAMPERLFSNTGISVCLWFIGKSRNSRGRQRSGEILFIDARKLGEMETRTLRVLDDDDVAKISQTYHNWRSGSLPNTFRDIPGFAKSASAEDVKAHGYILTPGRYVGSVDVVGDNMPIEERVIELRENLLLEFDEGRKLESAIRHQFDGIRA